MIGWAALLAALGPALGKALYEAGKKVLAEPLIEPATEQLKERMLRGYRERVDDAKLRGAMESAARAAGQWEELAEDYPLKRAHHYLAELSGGERQRAAIARHRQKIGPDPGQLTDRQSGYQSGTRRD
mgnify:CR=1 FL=1